MTEAVPLLRFNQGRAEVEARVEFLVKRGNLDIVDAPASVPQRERMLCK